MIMQDRAKRTMFYHDLGKEAKINHVLDKGSMVANPFFFGNSIFFNFIYFYCTSFYCILELQYIQHVTSIGEVLARLTNHS